MVDWNHFSDKSRITKGNVEVVEPEEDISIGDGRKVYVPAHMRMGKVVSEYDRNGRGIRDISPEDQVRVSEIDDEGNRHEGIMPSRRTRRF